MRSTLDIPDLDTNPSMLSHDSYEESLPSDPLPIMPEPLSTMSNIGHALGFAALSLVVVAGALELSTLMSTTMTQVVAKFVLGGVIGGFCAYASGSYLRDAIVGPE